MPACSGSIQVSTDNFATCVPLSGKVMSNGDKTVTFTPAPGLSFGITYKVRVTVGAQGATDNTPLGAAVTQAAGFTTRLSPASTGVVIAQVYGSGGLAGATYVNDYVVLHNRSGAAIDIGGWSLQYQVENANTWAVNALPAPPVSLAAGAYYLVKLGSGGAVGAVLAGVDATPAAGSDLAADKGKLALVSSAVQLADGCPAAGAPLVDLIGWGASAMACSEGVAPAPAAATAQESAQRKAIGCVDDGNNATDFVSAVAEVRSTTSLTNVCRVVHNEGGDGHELDYCADTTASVTVTAGGNMTLVGEVYEASLTTTPPAPAGASPKITAQVGYGPRNTNPQWQAGWTFAAATFSADSGNNDVYSTIVVAPAVNPLQYGYTYRFSLDSGTSWTYCDLAGAGANAALFFETTNLPLVTVNP